jgi:PAS domain S-box-containing protein
MQHLTVHDLISENNRLRALLQQQAEAQRKVEQAVGIERLLIRTLTDNMPELIYAKDAQSRFLFGNMAVADIMGASSPAALIGKSDYDFYAKELADQYFTDEQALLRSGDSLIGHEEPVADAHTGEQRTLLTTKVPLRDHDGVVIGIVGIGRDITDRKLVEVELLNSNSLLIELNKKLSHAQEQLVQSEKMASIGQLAAGVAHEINNPIGYVCSNISALDGYMVKILNILAVHLDAQQFITAPDVVERLNRLRIENDINYVITDCGDLMRETREGISRVRQIVQDLKDFSHADTNLDFHWADLHRGIDSTLNIISNELKYKADVVKEYGDIPPVECIGSQINQVIMNLAVNAAHAIGAERGVITLRTGLDKVHGDKVWIEVADTGCGIAPENVKRIFEPFYTTKPIGQGTGLGLALSYGIVQRHRGQIEVTSVVGQGTVFRVTLPLKHTPVDLQEILPRS